MTKGHKTSIINKNILKVRDVLITLLSRLFIKDNKNYENSVVRGKYGLLCGVWGIVLNLILFALKML